MCVRCILGGVLISVLWLGAHTLMGQELEPRAYASAPVGLRGFMAAYVQSSGSLLFDPALPLQDVFDLWKSGQSPMWTLPSMWFKASSGIQYSLFPPNYEGCPTMGFLICLVLTTRISGSLPLNTLR
jgi:hypothetical protein